MWCLQRAVAAASLRCGWVMCCTRGCCVLCLLFICSMAGLLLWQITCRNKTEILLRVLCRPHETPQPALPSLIASLLSMDNTVPGSFSHVPLHVWVRRSSCFFMLSHLKSLLLHLLVRMKDHCQMCCLCFWGHFVVNLGIISLCA